MSKNTPLLRKLFLKALILRAKFRVALDGERTDFPKEGLRDFSDDVAANPTLRERQ
jgi:hypothetical protein